MVAERMCLGGETVRKFGMDMCTLLYLKWVNSKRLLYSTWNSAQCYVADGRRVWGRMDACIYITESLHCSPETITTLLISYTSIENEKLKKKISTSFLKDFLKSSFSFTEKLHSFHISLTFHPLPSLFLL